MPSDKIHVGCQVGKVYRIVVQEEAEAFTPLGVLLEYVAQPKKKSKQGGVETLEESTARHSSPKAWVIAVIPVPEAFAPLPSRSELGMNIDAKWGLLYCMRTLTPFTTPLRILSLAEVGTTASADHLKWQLCRLNIKPLHWGFPTRVQFPIISMVLRPSSKACSRCLHC